MVSCGWTNRARRCRLDFYRDARIRFLDGMNRSLTSQTREKEFSAGEKRRKGSRCEAGSEKGTRVKNQVCR